MWTTINALPIILVSALLAILAIYLNGRRKIIRSKPNMSLLLADIPRRYEFREGYLLSDVDPTDVFLADDVDRTNAFDALVTSLEPIHAEIGSRLSALAERAEAFVLVGSFGGDPMSVCGHRESDRTVVTVGPADAGPGRYIIDRSSLVALQNDDALQATALNLCSNVVWRTSEDGAVVWANEPYFRLLDETGETQGGDMSWPIASLFAPQLDPAPTIGAVRRCKIELADAEEPTWFEVVCHPQADRSTLWIATPADRLVEAETSLRSFVQTLSKTFALLPVGLAVFDRQRQLVLFNPALVNLSTLDVQFLSARPSLVAFLDGLRDRQRMPEPRNYRAWRDQIARLEEGAENDNYQELWTLPTGQSFRVIGRPHPDGAIAFMFEDITSEVSLTREFRGEIDLYQALLDDMPGALAVFSGDGKLVLSNAAFADLWSTPARDIIGTWNLSDALGHWQAACQPTDTWDKLRGFSRQHSSRNAWSGQIEPSDGPGLTVRVTPLIDGAMSVQFLRADHGHMEVSTPATPPEALLAPRRVHEFAEAEQAFEARKTTGQS